MESYFFFHGVSDVCCVVRVQALFSAQLETRE